MKFYFCSLYLSESCSVVSNSLQPMDYTVHGILRQEYWSGVNLPFSRDLSNPGIKPRCPTLQADSLSAEPQEKPKRQEAHDKTLGSSHPELVGPCFFAISSNGTSIYSVAQATDFGHNLTTPLNSPHPNHQQILYASCSKHR